MKKFASLFIALMLLSSNVYAYDGEMGYFGGISPGVSLQTTIERSQSKPKKVSKYTLPYEETLYITGKPVKVTGTIEFKPTSIDTSKESGKYSESYIIKAQSKDGKSSLTRSVSLETQYLYKSSLKQATKTSSLTKWTEIAVIDGKTYQLDKNKSSFSKSIVEDYTPGVTYYKGDIAYEAVYKDINNGDSLITVEVAGPLYGYEQAYSKSETQRREVKVTGSTGEYFITENPSYTVNKELQYSVNEPNAISFGGNYREVINGSGNNAVDVLVGSPELMNGDTRLNYEIAGSQVIEQLVIPKIPNILNHPAKTDIEKLYSMQVMAKEPNKFSPKQVVTRGELIEILVKALDMEMPEVKKSKKKDETPKIFTDIKETDAVYPYAVAAYNSGLIGGGTFNKNQKVTREQFYTLVVRAIGLERLGLGGGITTPFVDDKLIDEFARSSMYAASKIGILPTENGYVFPTRQLNYGELSALMNKLIDYLRYDLQKDYNEHMKY